MPKTCAKKVGRTEKLIRSQSQVLETSSTLQSNKLFKRLFGRLYKKTQRRIVRYGILGANLMVLVLVIVFVVGSSGNNQSSRQNALAFTASTNDVASPVDQLSSADIAVNVARLAQLDEATSVANKADTVNAQLSITPAENSVVAKPEIITTSLKSRKDIQQYVTVPGDTISTLATKFGITSDTIRWSNNLSTEQIRAGTKLVISPINGIVYTVKAGDTVDSISARFHANKDHLVIFNDIELSGLPVGQQIVVPDGVQVGGSARAGTASFAWGGFSPVYGGNGYDYGYCTWWAAVRRAQIGRPVPSNLGNAATWKVLAQRAGLAVGTKPAAGAVIWTPPRDYYGHVGFVESVNADGSVNISEMNTAGWARVSHKTLSAAQAANYWYIY